MMSKDDFENFWEEILGSLENFLSSSSFKSGQPTTPSPKAKSREDCKRLLDHSGRIQAHKALQD